MIPDCFSLYPIQICLLHFGILDFFSLVPCGDSLSTGVKSSG